MPSTTAISRDNTSLAVHDDGGSGSFALATHGNGMCAAMLFPLAQALRPQLHTYALDLHGHGKSGDLNPPDFRWRSFADDVLQVIDECKPFRPVGIGHSLGATALLLAEAQRPGTFSWLHCYEPPMFASEEERHSAAMMTMVTKTRERRSHFASRQDAREHFAHRGIFEECVDDALDGYINDGLVDVGDGTVRLRLAPSDEAAIYEMAPIVNELGLEAIECPVVIAFGAATIGPEKIFARRAHAALASSILEPLEGLGHFGPLSHPELVANSIIHLSERATS